jgi:hypothetical protein
MRRSIVSQLSPERATELARLATDTHNPHVLGLKAREVFFLEDSVILVEGQEDAIYYPALAEQLGVELSGELFGWGVGGESKMPTIAAVLEELGFRRVVAVLDQSGSRIAEKLQKEHPQYLCVLIPADDVRCKEARPARAAVEGLLRNGVLQDRYRTPMERIVRDINSYLLASTAGSGARPNTPEEDRGR